MYNRQHIRPTSICSFHLNYGHPWCSSKSHHIETTFSCPKDNDHCYTVLISSRQFKTVSKEVKCSAQTVIVRPCWGEGSKLRRILNIDTKFKTEIRFLSYVILYKKDSQNTYNLTMRHLRVTIIDVEKQ